MISNDDIHKFKKKELAINTALQLQKMMPKQDFDLFKESKSILTFIDETDKQLTSKVLFIQLAEQIIDRNNDEESYYVAHMIISTLELLEKKMNGERIAVNIDARFTKTSLLDRIKKLS